MFYFNIQLNKSSLPQIFKDFKVVKMCSFLLKNNAVIHSAQLL